MTIRNLQHFSMTVPDLAIAESFYKDAGLDTSSRDGALVVRCFGRDQDQIVLTEGRIKRMSYVSYGTDEHSLFRIQRRLEKLGIKLIDAPRNVPGDGLWFEDFEGMLTNIRAADEAPWDRNPRITINTPDNRRARKGRTELIDQSGARPRRLGHIVLYSSDPFRKLAFYTEAFDMRLSDRVAGLLSFLHASTGSDHHIIAFAQSASYGLQHAGFDAATTDEVCAGAARMIDKGYIGSWGPGRHFVGSNVFAYVRDPWNSLFELFADMDYIGAEDNWEARDWEEVGTRSIWGDSQTSEFATNFETPHLR